MPSVMTSQCPPGTVCFSTPVVVVALMLTFAVAYLGYVGRWRITASRAFDHSMERRTTASRTPEHSVERRITDAHQRNRQLEKSLHETRTQLQDERTDRNARDAYVHGISSTPPLPAVLHVGEVVHRPPLRSDPRVVHGVPINVPTRGYAPEVQQVGILTNTDNDQILPLYGRPTYPGSGKWMYYTATDKFQSVKVPVHSSSRNCTDDLGCNELYDSDTVSVPAYGGREFSATIYSLNAPRYIPFI